MAPLCQGIAHHSQRRHHALVLTEPINSRMVNWEAPQKRRLRRSLAMSVDGTSGNRLEMTPTCG